MMERISEATEQAYMAMERKFGRQVGGEAWVWRVKFAFGDVGGLAGGLFMWVWLDRWFG